MRLFDAVSDAPDLEYLIVGGSIVRTHLYRASQKEQEMESERKYRGGLNTMHAAVTL